MGLGVVGFGVGPDGYRMGQHALRSCENATIGAALPQKRLADAKWEKQGRPEKGRTGLPPTERSAHRGSRTATKRELQRLDCLDIQTILRQIMQIFLSNGFQILRKITLLYARTLARRSKPHSSPLLTNPCEEHPMRFPHADLARDSA